MKALSHRFIPLVPAVAALVSLAVLTAERLIAGLGPAVDGGGVEQIQPILPPTQQPRLQFEDLRYRGAFRLPELESNGEGFSYGGAPIAFMAAPVIDRGPFVKGRAWDLTSALAQQLGVTQTEKVRAAPVP